MKQHEVIVGFYPTQREAEQQRVVIEARVALAHAKYDMRARDPASPSDLISAFTRRHKPNDTTHALVLSSPRTEWRSRASFLESMVFVLGLPD